MSSVLKAVNPATGKVIREVATDSAQTVQDKLEKAQNAYALWKNKSYAERGEVLNNVAKALRDKADYHAGFMTEEMGKPVGEALAEVEKSAWCAEHYAAQAEGYLATEIIASDAARSYVQYMPLGPVLGILPWNAPYWIASRFFAPALMAGNTCIMKHDPHVPGCAAALEQAFKDAGAPEGLFQAVYLQTPDVEALIRNPHIQAVSFTGSSQGGAAVAAIAASEIKPAVLELGGSDPCIVLDGADLDKAADIITLSRTINAGQSCIAAKRIIVEDSVYDQLIVKLEQRLSALSVGDPSLPENKIGPIARDDLRQNLHRQIRETISQGANCLLGGALPEGEGYFYPVTLLTDVTPNMCAYQEETFGPVAAIIKTANSAEAIKLANDTAYGLGASIWCADPQQGEKLAHQIVAGQVAVNGIVKTDPRLPSGGVKRSGYGRELGPHGIKEFTNGQQIWIGA
jgi:succinate-semialdehyde dehydrogenase/glutarate-semialdehyde dehydrogenase